MAGQTFLHLWELCIVCNEYHCPPEDHICPSCKNGVKDEIQHVFAQYQLTIYVMRPKGSIFSKTE